MSERFNRAINALVQSYLNNTLRKGTCQCCAVGNIVAAGYGGQVTNVESAVVSADGVKNNMWGLLFSTGSRGEQTYMNWGMYHERMIWLDLCKETVEYEAKHNVEATGYTVAELARIENAFETNTKITFLEFDNYTEEQNSEDQYNGLMAVVDVLCDIEGIKDASEYKQLFSRTNDNSMTLCHV